MTLMNIFSFIYFDILMLLLNDTIFVFVQELLHQELLKVRKNTKYRTELLELKVEKDKTDSQGENN